MSEMPNDPSPLPRRIAEIASSRHGIVDLAQLNRVGLSRSTITDWVISGRLFRLYRGVYSIVPALMLSQEGQWLAAVKTGGEGAALSHGPAGQLQWIIDRRDDLALHVSVPNRSDRKPPGVVVHRPRQLLPIDLTTRFWIPTTTPTRTVWDVSSAFSPLQTRRAFEQAEKRGALDRRRLGALLAVSPSRSGAGTIRQLLAERPLPLSETRSWLEELLVITCRDNGLPLPVINAPLLDYEVDFLWPRERFVIEADGSDHLLPRQRDRDNERDIALARAGFLVRRYSYLALGREADVVREVVEILSERRALFG